MLGIRQVQFSYDLYLNADGVPIQCRNRLGHLLSHFHSKIFCLDFALLEVWNESLSN